MGNGFTFELETLIFWSLAIAASASELGDECTIQHLKDGTISQYGDDCIVPSSVSSFLIFILEESGFTINREKSFEDGNFRESCGGDFFNGREVNSVQMKKFPSNPNEWIGLHNRIKERFVDHYCKPHILKIVKENIPTRSKVYGPTSLGDLVLHGDKWTGKQVRSEWSPFESVWEFRVLLPKLPRVNLKNYSIDAQLASFMYTLRSEAQTRRIAKVKYYKETTLLYSKEDESRPILSASLMRLSVKYGLGRLGFATLFSDIVRA